MLKYIELKTGYSDDGPAWVGFVKQSKSGKTIYFNGKALERSKGISGNHRDIETREEYWISNVKKNGGDRHWAGKGKIKIEAGAIKEYLKQIGKADLDKANFEVSDEIVETDVSKFEAIQNERLT